MNRYALFMADQSLIETTESMSLEDLRREARVGKARFDFLNAGLAVREDGGATLNLQPARGTSSASLELGPAPPSKRKAVLRVLGEKPDKPMRLIDLKNELVRRGWL